jgi:hypothetical protein
MKDEDGNEIELQAEPAVYFNGKRSDASEHLAWLDNPEANALADEEAIRQAMVCGLSREEASAMMSGPTDLSFMETGETAMWKQGQISHQKHEEEK